MRGAVSVLEKERADRQGFEMHSERVMSALFSCWHERRVSVMEAAKGRN